MHWYNKLGEPAYTIIGKNGKERNTTLADARKEHYVPSVTTILSILAKPQLDIWKVNQALDRAANYPYQGNELPEEWIRRTQQQVKQEQEKVTDFGTDIHNALEDYFSGGIERLLEYIQPTIEYVWSLPDKVWQAEQSFAHKYGYGGKVDLISPFNHVIDYKTKNFTAIKDKMTYPEHGMQLAAYGMGLGMDLETTKFTNIFISSTVPGLTHVHIWDNKEIVRLSKIFLVMLELWKLINQYDSSF